MRCPQCAYLNRPGALFCLACGEPIGPDADVPAPTEEAPEVAPRTPRWWRGREPLLGAAVLLVALILVAYTTWQGLNDRQASAYAAGVSAQQDGHWDTAVGDFQRAGDYADAPRRLAATRALAAQWDPLDAAATAAENGGAWWDAAVSLGQMAALDPGYPGLTARLAAARQHAGMLVYRQGQGGGATLWSAYADGTDPLALPYSAGGGVYGISPDDRFVVYSGWYYRVPGTVEAGLYVYDLQRRALDQVVALPPEPEPDAVPVRFRADSRGFWWVAGDRWSYYDFAARTLTPLTGPVLGADTRNARVVYVATALPGSRYSRNSSVALPLASHEGDSLLVAGVPGQVDAARLSPDGRLLIYQMQTGTATISVAYALPAPAPPPGGTSTVLWVDPLPDGSPTPPLTVGFAPLGLAGAECALLPRDGHLLQVCPDLPTAQPFSAGSLQLGPDYQVLGLDLSAAGWFQGIRLGSDMGQVIEWLGYTPDGHAVLYTAPDGAGGRALYLASVSRQGRNADGSPRDPARLLDPLPAAGLAAARAGFSLDGLRFLAIRDGGADGAPGLWAVHLDGSDPTLVVPDATAFWTAQGALLGP